MDLNLRSRVAIVTGGSQGIGYATAEELLKEGVAVSVCARDETRLASAQMELAQKTAGRIEAIRADVMVAEQIQAFVAETERRLGPVDILINNAANYYDGDMVEMLDEHWDHHIATKFKAYMRFVRLLAPGMKERGWGRIMNLGGGARTQRREIAIRRPMEHEGLTHEEVERDMIAHVPIGRMIEASDAAKLITFLFSDQADGITGQTISVDGGADRAVDY